MSGSKLKVTEVFRSKGKLMYKVILMVISSILLSQGCSGSSVKQQKPADVTSNPSGATVYADDQKLGETPLRYKLYEAFPAGWKNAMFQAQGVLKVKTDGCEDFTLRVSDNVLSKPIHAELKCSEANKTEKSTTAVIPHSGIEKKLEELDALKKKGIITKDEYDATRMRILNEL
jgi:hypothetical protein